MSKTLYGRQWPEDFPYRFFIGMHTVDADQCPHIPGLLSEMDGREIIRRLADAGVDAVYYYMSCHSGSCFYPTEVKPGHMHSGLNGRDVFGEAADEAQKQKIALIAVYEFENRRMIESGPREWMHYYPKAPNNKMRACLCWNTGYGEFVLKQLAEVSQRYPVAGFYVDMLDFPGLVCCEHCARRFKEEIGVAPPRAYDPDSALFKVFRLWGYGEEARFLRVIRNHVQGFQPDVTVINNYHCLRCEDLYEVADANDYLSTDPGIGFMKTTTRMNVLTAIYGSLSRGKPAFEMLRDPRTAVISIQPETPYNAATALATSQGAASAYPSCMLDRKGRLRDAPLALTRRASAFAKARYPWRAEGERMRFAGLYLSQESELFYAGDFLYGRQSGGAYDNPYINGFCGAYLMLQEEHVPTDILCRRDLDRLEEYPVVFLANVACMSELEAAAFRKYVENGGTLVASYRTSLGNEWNEEQKDFQLGDVLGVSWAGKDLDPFHAFQLPLPDGEFATEDWESRDVSVPGPALVCRAEPESRVLVHLHDRYRDAKQGGPLRNAYTCEKPEGPGIVEHRFGKGRCIYFAGSIFAAYLRSGIPTLKKLAVRWMLEQEIEKRSPVKLEGPNCVELTAYAQPDRNRVLVHLVNLQVTPGRQSAIQGAGRVVQDVLPVHDLKLRTHFAAGDVLEVILQPAGQRLEATPEAQGTAVVIPRVEVHDIVELRLRPGVCPEYPDSRRQGTFVRYDLKAKARDYVESSPPGYDPDDDGVWSFEDVPDDTSKSRGEEWDGLGAMQGGNN